MVSDPNTIKEKVPQASQVILSRSARHLRRPKVVVLLILFLTVFWYGTRNQDFVQDVMYQWDLTWGNSNGISPKQKAQLHEVADLLLDIYETLAEMRYLDPIGIRRGPHNIDSLRPVYDAQGLDPSVVYLYSILPYIDIEEAGNRDFLQGGTFADFRNPDEVIQGRDPFYAGFESEDFNAENGPYMRPWYTALSHLGNHQSAIIYDSQKHRIWIIDQEGWSSTDLALSGVPDGKESTANRNSFEHIPSRHAGNVLRDINAWYRMLKELPGGENSGSEWSNWNIDLKTIYRENGWPNDFDGDAFEVDQLRASCAAYAKGFAERPLDQVKNVKTSITWAEEDMKRFENEVIAAKTEDETWLAKFDLWRAARRKTRFIEDLDNAQKEAERLCPNDLCQKKEDLPLWEFEAIRPRYKYEQGNLERLQNSAKEVKNDTDHERTYQTKLRFAQRRVILFEKAYKASKAQVDHLEKTFESATGIKSLAGEDTLTSIQRHKDSLDLLQSEIRETREWAIQIPEAASKARAKVDEEIQRMQKTVEGIKEKKLFAEKWLNEHGNTN